MRLCVGCALLLPMQQWHMERWVGRRESFLQSPAKDLGEVAGTRLQDLDTSKGFLILSEVMTEVNNTPGLMHTWLGRKP